MYAFVKLAILLSISVWIGTRTNLIYTFVSILTLITLHIPDSSCSFLRYFITSYRLNDLLNNQKNNWQIN